MEAALESPSYGRKSNESLDKEERRLSKKRRLISASWPQKFNAQAEATGGNGKPALTFRFGLFNA